MTSIAHTARRIVSIPFLLLALLCATAALTAAPAAEAYSTVYRYHFTMTTCDIWLAGTDANVEVRLDGSKGNSGWLLMDDLLVDDHERGSSEGYSIPSYFDLGTIEGFWVKRDKWGAGDGWCLSSIKLTKNAHHYEVEPRMFAWGKWVDPYTPIHLTSWVKG